VAIELARRGLDVVGTDLDPDMIGMARAKVPELTWVHADLSELDLPTRFDAVVLAGNVIPYVASDRRQAAIVACARHLAPGGRLIAGFQLRDGWPSVADYDRWCDSADLALEDRYATWDRHPFTDTDSYAVSVHRWRLSR
jgi:SAM-dependent methyltransferase